MGKKELQAFIDAKKECETKDAIMDWGKQKDEWLASLKQLYGLVEEWLKNYVDSEVVSFEYISKEMHEEHIGMYNVEKVIINIASEKVMLDPIGTLLVGAKGRVDMKGKNGRIKFVLVPKQSIGSSIQVSVKNDIDSELEKQIINRIEWVWKIATQPPFIKYIDLDNDSFSDALLEVIGD